MSQRPSTTGAAVVPMESEQTEMPAAIKMKRRVHINVTGTMNQFHASGTQAAMWKPVDNKVTEMFGLNDSEGVCIDAGSMSNSLRNAVILKATMLEAKSTFPIPLGVSISCLPSEEITDSGEKFACTVLPNSTNSNPIVIYQTDASSDEGIEWRNKYPNYNASNLDTWGILDVQKCPFVFVHKEHPAIDLLRVNKDILGSDIDELGLLDDQFHKISRQVLTTCNNMIRNKVLSRVSTRDLNNFSVQLHPLNDSAWTDHGAGSEIVMDMPVNPMWTASQQDDAETQFAQAQQRKVCSYVARMELEYEIQP